MGDVDFTDEGDRRLLAALGHGPGLTPQMRDHIAAAWAEHMRRREEDTAEDARTRTDLLADAVYRRHGPAGVVELRRLAGEW